jgi:hypothetical protein
MNVAFAGVELVNVTTFCRIGIARLSVPAIPREFTAVKV